MKKLDKLFKEDMPKAIQVMTSKDRDIKTVVRMVDFVETIKSQLRDKQEMTTFEQCLYVEACCIINELNND